MFVNSSQHKNYKNSSIPINSKLRKGMVRVWSIILCYVDKKVSSQTTCLRGFLVAARGFEPLTFGLWVLKLSFYSLLQFQINRYNRPFYHINLFITSYSFLCAVISMAHKQRTKLVSLGAGYLYKAYIWFREKFIYR